MELLLIFKKFIQKSDMWLKRQSFANEGEEAEAKKTMSNRKFSTKQDPSLSIIFRNRKKLAKIEDLTGFQKSCFIKSKLFGTESSKYLFQTRINVCLLYILLADNEKDFVFALTTIHDDLEQ